MPETGSVHQRWHCGLTVWMTLASLINYMGRSVISVGGADIAKEFHFSEAQLGEIFSAFWLGYAVMQWPSGWLSDRFGGARVLGLCGLATAALLFGTIPAATLLFFLLVRGAFGVASAVLYPECASITSHKFAPSVQSTVQGFVIGGGSLGIALTPYLMTAAGSWRMGLACAAAITAVFFALWIARLRIVHLPKPVEGGPLRINRGVFLLAVQSMAIAYYYNFTDTWAFYYFREVRGFSNDRAALFTLLLQISGGLAMFFGGLFIDKIAPRTGRVWPSIVALTVASCALAASVVTNNSELVLALIVLSYTLTTACEGVFSWAVITAAPHSAGASYGFVNMCGSVAQVAAPLAFPWLAARFTWDGSVYSAALSLLIGAGLWFIATRQYLQRPLAALTK
ncbi:MAG: MFS transporter [Acidobacteria bacterium]|nr:MFS transporter [Acidobacteriota bacterium]